MNIIPETPELNGTVRTYDVKVKEKIMHSLERRIMGIGEAMGAKIDYTYFDVCAATINTSAETEFALSVARKLSDHVDSNTPKSMGGEDFGGFLSRKSGCYMGIGQGMPGTSPHNYMLHNPHYDFNDALIPIGGAYFVQLVEDYCPL